MQMKQSLSHSNCPICGGSGWIYHTDENGYEIAERCDCYKREFNEAVNRRCGLTPDELGRLTLAKFTDSDPESKKMLTMAEAFLEDQTATGIGYFGKSGTGKTHICVGICQELAKRRTLAWKYFSYRAEIQSLQALAFDARAYRAEMQNFAMVPILYIDDLLKFSINKDGKFITSELRILYDLINTRYLNKKITVFSSEYTLSYINKVDEALGGRIYEMVKPYGLRLSGKNKRLGYERDTVF